MIPKIIHYCWFGGKPLSPMARRCIDSWKKYCPDYQIKRWDETNFDLNSCTYIREAYEAKKWAFITDYVRLCVMYNYGGIYMDTDVEVLKNLDCFLSEKAFSGFESVDRIPTGIMASEKECPIIKELLDRYQNRHFLMPDGSLDLTTNVEEITKVMINRGLVLNGTKQTVEGFTFYPKDYFCPKDYRTRNLELTTNSYAIHHFDGSWVPKSLRVKSKIVNLIGRDKWVLIKSKLHLDKRSKECK